MVSVEAPGWEGWSFKEDFLVSPTGQTFTARCVLMCHFLRQSEGFGSLLHAGVFDHSQVAANSSVLGAAARSASRSSINGV
jgi:hypothetical protein